jgi:hypothetical protein
MEIEGASYLYTLALLAITYGGFAALFMLFRENLRDTLVAYDAFLIRAVIQKSFIVAFCAMLPPLLSFAAIPHETVWQLSSLVAGLMQALWLIAWMARRMRVKGVPTSTLLILNLSAQVLTSIYLFVGASGKAFHAGPGHFMIGVTLILAWSCIAYQEAIVFLLQRDIAEKVR